MIFCLAAPFQWNFAKLAAGYAGKMEIGYRGKPAGTVEAVNAVLKTEVVWKTVLPEIKRSCGNENFKRDTWQKKKVEMTMNENRSIIIHRNFD